MKKKMGSVIIKYFMIALVVALFQQPIMTSAATKIAKVNAATVTVKQGKAYSLPKTVVATMSNGKTSSVPVTWSVAKVDTKKTGKFIIKGNVKGYSKKVDLILNIEKYIMSIDNITTLIKQNDTFNLPGAVKANMSDGTTVECSIAWSGNQIDTTSPGELKFEGKVKNYDKKVLLTLKIEKFIQSINDMNITVKHEENYQLASVVNCKMSDGSTEDKPITWNVNQLDTSKTGGFDLEGTVDGYSKKVNLRVTIESYIKSIDNAEVTTIQENKFTFPSTIKAKMSDGKEKDVSVKWMNPTLNTNEVGKYTFIGEVDGYNSKPMLIVTVKSNKLDKKEIAAAYKGAVVHIDIYSNHGYIFATGSGFIVSSDGKVVTNYHVIDGARKIKVVMDNGTSYEVESVLNYSKEKDIAIIKLKDAKDLPVVKLGNSDKLVQGEEVVAIGNPENFNNTVSSGIISGLSRKSTVRSGNDIQIDVPITHGSSGGALFNLKGEVVGITSSGMETTGNLNFAIPINEVIPLLESDTPVAIMTLFPLTDYEKFEMELQKKFAEISVNGSTIKVSDFYIDDDKLDDGTPYLYVVIDFYNNNYDDFMKSLTKDPQSSSTLNNRSVFETWLRTVLNEIRQKYSDKPILGEVDGIKYLDAEPKTGYDDYYYKSSIGKWVAYNEETLFGMDKYNYMKVAWYPFK